MPEDNAFWETIRRDYFDLSPDSIYMNCSTLGPTLKSVRAGMAAINELFVKGCPLGAYVEKIVGRPMDDLARQVQRLLVREGSGGPLPRIGFVNNVTEGMSLIANGLTFRPGDVILITDHEHTGGRSMWQLQAERYNAKVVVVPLLGAEGADEGGWKDGLIERFRKAFAEHDVRAMSVPWCTTSTGHILPVKDLCSLAAQAGAHSVVDAAQIWAVRPIDFFETGCDFMAMNGHKYLCGPIGSGFIAVHPRVLERRDDFWPTIVDDYNYPQQPYDPAGPQAYAPFRKGGIAPVTNILPLKEALAFYSGSAGPLDPAMIHAQLLAIGTWLRTGLASYPGVFELLTPAGKDLSCVMTCFRVRGQRSANVVGLLGRKYAIHVKNSVEGGADCVRIAAHYFNTADEFMALAKALCEIANVPERDWPAFGS